MKKEEEYELVPLSPLRRLEKRLEKLESSIGIDTKEFYKELVNIIRINQQVVSELVKANDLLRMEISRLPPKLDDLISKLDELLTFIKASSVEEVAPPAQYAPLAQKIDQLIEANKLISQTIENILSSLEDLERRIKRPVHKPLIRPKRKI
jgi:DNA repair exonuclease SbcCD ATPase subunit